MMNQQIHLVSRPTGEPSAAGKHITGQILAVDGGVSCYVPQ